MLQGVMMMFSNPMYATSSGGKMQKIAGQKAIVTFDPERERGSIKFVVNNRYYIEINGKKASEEEIMAYAEAIDFQKIIALK